MDREYFNLKEISVIPEALHFYVPPIVWKGDSVGHIGKRDLFFWVIEGECFLRIDSQNYIIRPGQLAYLPKGKLRAYTHASERFSMYEMAFSAKSGNQNLMELLGLTEENFVVDVPDAKQMSHLFESSNHKEFLKDPLYDVLWCSNILSIIKIYAEERSKQSTAKSAVFKPVLEYMSQNINRFVKTEDLAALCFMQPTYFIKKFHECYQMPPIAYFNRMKIYKAMGLLSGTELSVEEISKEVGFFDTSYFTRVFKKYCNVTPSRYRAEFKKRI